MALLMAPSVSAAQNSRLDNLEANQSTANQSTANQWTATWATASKAPVPGFDAPPPALNNTTLRQIVRISEGGQRARIWFSNEMGTSPLNISAASVAIRAEGAAINSSTLAMLTFAGDSRVVIAPGTRVVSDPLTMHLADRSDLSISIYLPDDLSASGSPLTQHIRALQTNYLAPGNQVAALELESAEKTTAWHFLAAVDVANPWPMPVIALLGDSITDGDQLTAPNEPIDQNARLSDFLSEAIIQAGKAAGVINLGLSGNLVTQGFLGETPEARLSRDVLTQTGVSHVMLLAGINDIGFPVLRSALGVPTPEVTAAEIIQAHSLVVERVKAAGLVSIGATLTPAGGSPLPGYSGVVAEGKRQTVNEWIRNSGAYDIVVDLDAALQDPADPSMMRADLTADGLHPNSEGYRVAAEAVFTVIGAQLPQKRFEKN